MLTELRIENLGVIAELGLVLHPGMTALTGETGAGKTMLVEAISLLVGGRADATLVRPGAAEARVEGRFLVGDDEIVLARVIPVDGRSRAYVNGRLATVANLSEEGSHLVDLHGQHSHQSLLTTSAQRAALDRFGNVDRQPLRDARAHLTEIDAALAALGGDARARAREIDLLRFQLDELTGAQLDDADEEERLSREEDVLAGAVAHRDAAARAAAALSDDDGALDRVGLGVAALTGRSPFDDLTVRLRALGAEMDDVAAELRRRSDAIEDDPDRVEAVRRRRQLLRDLRRKYGESLTEVIAYRDDVAGRLSELESYETRVAALETQRTHALAAEAAAAAVVGQARRKAAPALARAVAANLNDLAMARARIEVVVGEDPGDDVTFLLGANPGEPAHPLAKVASGGELARTMLALRLVLTEAPDTLVFDEVDAGIGGEAARAVGASLAALGSRHQVLVVTHFAQVAAFAGTQIAVTKAERHGRTVATARAVTGDARVRELSRMLSGLADSGSARQHAEELLDAAADVRGR
jgi:DNA repair protein RecN (Recombination protein N)